MPGDYQGRLVASKCSVVPSVDGCHIEKQCNSRWTFLAHQDDEAHSIVYILVAPDGLTSLLIIGDSAGNYHLSHAKNALQMRSLKIERIVSFVKSSI